MWKFSDGSNDFQMAEGDYGIELQITAHGPTLTANDSVKFVFKQRKNGPTILEKEYTSIQNNVINLEFTKEDSEKFNVGSYVYRLDWYQDGEFMCNIVESACFKVVDKA